MSTMKKKICQCPMETSVIIEKEYFGLYRHLGRRLRKEYIAKQEGLQIALGRYLDEGGDKSPCHKDEMPPCVNCHPAIFAFCAATGHECNIFDKYTSSGKQETHVCLLRMDALKAKRPDLERYCSEDERIMCDPQSHKDAAAKRRAMGIYDK